MLNLSDAASRRRTPHEDLSDHIIDVESPVFVDFDHTLFACNSTELFIASCRPKSVAAFVDFVIRQCIPWRLTGLTHWFRLRDYVCCVVLLVCCPWNHLLWRRAAPKLFIEHVSSSMSRALSIVPTDRLFIVTFGMDFVVRALLRGTRWQDARLIATPLLGGFRRFSRGKLPLVNELLAEETVSAATFISDSLDDDDLLQAARTGILVKPQGDRFRSVEHLYLPLRYTARVKYSHSYVFDQIVLVELLVALISVADSLTGLLTDLPLISCLTLSLMCVYEIGYYENDFLGARMEQSPTLGPDLERFRSYPILPAAWLWAIAIGGAGLVLGRETGALSRGFLDLGLVWLTGLAATRAAFWCYNRVELRARTFFYPVLQILKFLPIFVLIQPTRVGVVLVLCQVATMWTIYLVYRLGGYRRDIEKEAIRTSLLVLGLLLLASSGSMSTPGGLFTLAMVSVWSVARLAKAPILRAFRRRVHVST